MAIRLHLSLHAQAAGLRFEPWGKLSSPPAKQLVHIRVAHGVCVCVFLSVSNLRWISHKPTGLGVPALVRTALRVSFPLQQQPEESESVDAADPRTKPLLPLLQSPTLRRGKVSQRWGFFLHCLKDTAAFEAEASRVANLLVPRGFCCLPVPCFLFPCCALAICMLTHVGLGPEGEHDPVQHGGLWNWANNTHTPLVWPGLEEALL